MDIGGSQRRFSQLGKKVQTIKRLRSFRLQRTTFGRWRRTRTVFPNGRGVKALWEAFRAEIEKGGRGSSLGGSGPNVGGQHQQNVGGSTNTFRCPCGKMDGARDWRSLQGASGSLENCPQRTGKNDIIHCLWPSSCLFQQICCLLVTKSLLAQGNLIRCTNGHTAHTYSQCHQYA